MTATTLELQPELSIADIDLPTRPVPSLRPTVLALAVTLAAFGFNAPGRFAALLRSKAKARIASEYTVIQTAVSYPVPSAPAR